MMQGRVIALDPAAAFSALVQGTAYIDAGTASGTETIRIVEDFPKPPQISVAGPTGGYISARNRRRLDKRKK